VDVTSRTITVRARNANTNGKLRPGAFAHITVQLSKVPTALMIPTEALIPDIQGQKVLVIKNGKAVSARVETGIRTNTEVELTSGVQPGDTVITTGLLAAPRRHGREGRTAGTERNDRGNRQFSH
jgi:membrane fusion protein (multidrug efflux system)